MKNDQNHNEDTPNNPHLVQVAATPLFPYGNIVMTPGARALVSFHDLALSFARHCTGDWGDIPAEDKEANDLAVILGSRILSVYQTAQGVTFWVITEADRFATTFLLPEEY